MIDDVNTPADDDRRSDADPTGRRDLMKKMAIGGAIVWAAPAIVRSTPAAAQTSPPPPTTTPTRFQFVVGASTNNQRLPTGPNVMTPQTPSTSATGCQPPNWGATSTNSTSTATLNVPDRTTGGTTARTFTLLALLPATCSPGSAVISVTVETRTGAQTTAILCPAVTKTVTGQTVTGTFSVTEAQDLGLGEEQQPFVIRVTARVLADC
jgi:hypothetical protein